MQSNLPAEMTRPGCGSRSARRLATLLALAMTAPGTAQATMTASVTQPLFVSAYSNGQTTTSTQPVGPLPTTSTALTASQTGTMSSLVVGEWPSSTLPAGATGWQVCGELQMSVTSSWGFYATASLTGGVRLHVQSPVPVNGVLYLVPQYDYSSPFQTYSGDLTVDLDGDGVPDHRASAPSSRAVEVPITLDAAGRDVQVDLGMSASWALVGSGTIFGHAIVSWDVLFLPEALCLETSSVGCVPMDFGRVVYTRWKATAGCYLPTPSAPAMVFGGFLFGISEQSVPLPYPPGCPQLVANPVVVAPTRFWPEGIEIDLPDVWIPPGLHFYLQGVWLDSQNQVFTSDSIRTK